MNRTWIIPIGASVLLLWGVCRAEPLARVTPNCAVAEYRCQDLNQDECLDLLAIGKAGEVMIWAGQCEGDVAFVEVGEVWTLPDPQRSLLTLSSWSADSNDVALLVLASDGLWAYPVRSDGGISSQGTRINRRMKSLFRVGQPAFSNFLQDINQDGRFDVLVPGVNRCELWLNQGSGDTGIPNFKRVGTFPVRMSHHRATDMDNGLGVLSEWLKVPSLRLTDVNGDQVLDLVVQQDPHYDYYLMDAQGEIPDEPTVSLDLSLFKDTTPQGEKFEFGEILNPNVNPHLYEADLNNDGITDYLISHQRKLWFFHGSPAGPQFTDPVAILKMAEDMTVTLLCPLDEDEYPDLLIVRLRVPTLTQLLGGFFAEFDIKISSSGYRSHEGRSFELSSNWQGEVFVRLPSILSMIRDEDLLEGFDVDPKYGSTARGDFNGDAWQDVAMVNTETRQVEFWLGQEQDQVSPASVEEMGRDFCTKIRELAFARDDNVWDIDRIKQGINALMNKQVLLLTQGREPTRIIEQEPDLILDRIAAVDLNQDGRDEMLWLYRDPLTDEIVRFEFHRLEVTQ